MLVFVTMHSSSSSWCFNLYAEGGKVDQILSPLFISLWKWRCLLTLDCCLVSLQMLVNFGRSQKLTGCCWYEIEYLVVGLNKSPFPLCKSRLGFILSKSDSEEGSFMIPKGTGNWLENMRRKKKEDVSRSETREDRKKASYLKAGIKRIGSICSRSRDKGHDVHPTIASILLKEETGQCSFDDVDDNDDSCLWLSSSKSPSSFFGKQSSFDEERMISSWVLAAMPSILEEAEQDLGSSWVLEFEKDMSFLVDLDMEWDYFCIPSSFPSPSFNTSTSSRDPELIVDAASESEHLNITDDVRNDDKSPLLWPFEGEHSWNPEEAWSFFTMSPRKDIGTTMSMNSNRGNRRRKISLHREVVDPDSKPSVERVKSRLKKSTRLEINNNNNKDHHETDLFDAISSDDVSIEMLVGLEEFDGKEGMMMDSSHEHVKLK
ncbi:hypothetical protein LINPERPRIM_LOCUS8316 [Linum perenne]